MALLLGGLAVLLALAYAGLAAAPARPGTRAGVIVVAAVLLVVLPSVALMGMGAATDRPYGQDGGVVQLPLAIDKILAGASPYGADYSGTVLARQARVSAFWDEFGGNPILRHHAYLPGTHLVMVPFLLASRAVFGGFDPRLVTLVFYAMVVLLAARLPASAEARLAAAGAAALNPLVYWHQVFGANDLVFVAMLLGAVLLARGRKPLAAAALLGLACATKQLAWPFAPFLLVTLGGARSLSGLAADWRRLRPPLAAAAFVFLAVVLPVAALDFRAFWGDIVVYNVGLPGGDNYPLGGTPGFGFANFLVAFARVGSLRDYFPFSVFYVLLVPLGLLLVREQLRSGRPEWSLATGSAALLASIYFSRVVHPNYLVPAAVLLPVAVLAVKRGADVALAPLLLVALGVEAVENQVFRSAWDQAVAAGLTARALGLFAVLVPRAGPHLTKDPAGLLFGATAAGLGVLYLALAVCDASRRSRLAVAGLAVVVLVGLPVALLAGLTDRTGIVRAQDPAVVQSRADSGRILAGRSPYSPPPQTEPRGREAVSRSFRLDPPGEILPSSPMFPPGPSVVAALVRPLGIRDLRVPAVFLLATLAAVLAATIAEGDRPVAVALALLSGPMALGTVLGAPYALSLAALVGAWAASRRGADLASGVLAGVAVALDHRAALVAPFLVVSHRSRSTRPEPGSRGTARGWMTGAVGAYLVLVGPILLLDRASFVARLREPVAPGPGLGLVNLLAYRGGEASAIAFALAALSPLVAAAVVLWLLRRPWPTLALGGMASMSGLVLAPVASPEAVAVPVVLLGLAALSPRDEPERQESPPGDTQPSTP